MTDYTGVVDIARNGVDETIRISRQVGDLAMIVARLARSLKCACPGNKLAADALDYLKRNNFQCTVMREATPADPQSHQP